MFSIRELSLAESLPPGATADAAELLGARLEFRRGISIDFRLPSDPAAFGNLAEPVRVLASLKGWARIYRYPERSGYAIHVLATAEEDAGGVLFYRLDLWQRRKLRGPQPPVEILGSAIMDYDECARWLVELAHKRAISSDYSEKFQALSRTHVPRLPDIRLAWVGPDVVDGARMSERLTAIGQVYDAGLVQVAPISFAHVHAQLKLSTFHSVIICNHYAPYIGTEVVPSAITQNLVHLCNSSNRATLEQQIRTWLEVAAPEIRAQQQHVTPLDEDKLLLGVMLQGMISHSKIGPNNHCPRETVLKRIRGRHLNAAAAEQILDEVSEKYESTKNSQCMVLWKDHNDGRQYFVNSKQVEQVRAIIASIPGSNGAA